MAVAVAAAALAVLWAGPAKAGAATEIGAIEEGESSPPACDVSNLVQASVAANRPSYTVPSDGVITSWSHRGADASPGSGRLQVWRPAGGTDYTLVGRSNIQAFVAGEINEFATSIPVRTGDVLGLRVSSAGVGCAISDQNGNLTRHDGPAASDATPGETRNMFSTTNLSRLNVSATLDPGAPLQFKGDEGVSINDGDRFTNDPEVELHVVPPANTTQVRLANDGGFAQGVTRAAAESGRYGWTLDSSGPERLPKTAYVRFGGENGFSPLTFTDDIILDETPPKIVSAEAVGSSAGAAAIARKRAVKIKVKAKDKTSGVKRMQIGKSKRKARKSKWKKYRKNSKYKGGGRKAFVRVRDGAKNPSKWKKVRLR